MENVAQKIEKSIPGAIKIDEKEVFDHLDTLVRQSVVSEIPYALQCTVSPFSTLPAAIQKEFPGWFYREFDLLWN